MFTARKRQTIMLVDDNQATLTMGKKMLQDFYEVYALPSVERFFTFLENVTPDLILLDIAMPGMSGFEILKILKANAAYAEIPVVFVTANTGKTAELEGLAAGAVDYVTKPFSPAILLKRIENHLLIKKQQAALKILNDNLIAMVKEKTIRVIRLQNAIIHTVAEVVELRDAHTGGHINRTQQYVQLLINYLIEHDVYAEEILTWNNMDVIAPSTQLHDLGKVFISDAILNKPGKLTPEEFAIMKTHVIKGVEAIRKMAQDEGEEDAFLQYAIISAQAHHEKWDGSGYPLGLKGQDIPLLGRLMAIADVYDALISTRPYKAPLTAEKAAQSIIAGSGKHFDPVLVDIFTQVESEFASIARSHGADG